MGILPPMETAPVRARGRVIDSRRCQSQLLSEENVSNEQTDETYENRRLRSRSEVATSGWLDGQTFLSAVTEELPTIRPTPPLLF